MKTKRIILVRHGQSVANEDWTKHETIPDHELDLTAVGWDQSARAGKEIRAYTREETIRAYVSPFYRTRQTFAAISWGLKDRVVQKSEDPRLREQDWGHLRGTEEGEAISKARDNYGSFYYRIPDGESGADVYDRITSFMDTLHRDFEKEDFPRNVVIVLHGLSLRIFLMRWFHWTVEEFQSVVNPKNCQVVVMDRVYGSTKYKLLTPLKKRS